jgi:hypothetical protein
VEREFSGAGVAGPGVIRRHRRGRWRGLAGLAALGAACGLAVVACAGPSGPSGQSSPSSPSADGAAAASASSQLRQRIEAAQDPADYVIKTTEAQQQSGSGAPPVVTTVWTDLATGNAMLQRGSGSARVANWERDYYEHRVLHWDQTQVDYGSRTWWTADEHAAAPVSGPVPSGSTGGGYTPAPLVEGVFGNATDKIVGYPVLDGRRTIELSASVAGSQFELWADSSTYRVIRTEKYFPATTNVPPITFDYDWIPASAAMVALINHPQVPAGFTQVQVDQH